MMKADSIVMDRSSQNRGQAGFGLIEMAIVIAISGVLLVGFLHLMDGQMKRANIESTDNKINAVSQALKAYMENSGRLPCPARRDLTPDDVNFGTPTNCSDATVTAGNCANGYCVQQSVRTWDHDNNAATAQIPIRVRIGAVPIRELNLTYESARDAWGGLIMYAVSEPLVLSASNISAGGGITIIDGNGNSLITPSDTASYVVWSAGADGRGSLGACAATGYDVENCFAPGATTVPTAATFRATLYNDVDGAAHFDDRVIYAIQGMGCASAAVTWLSLCSATAPSAATGNIVALQSTAAGHTSGTANFICANGTWQFVTGTCP